MRYKKQERFEPLKNSVEMLKSKRVAVVGLGGLGSHSAEYLVRMGVGNLILIDDDFVEESNLPRQGLYYQKDAESMSMKVDCASNRLKLINPDISISEKGFRLNERNISSALREADLVIDGTDNLKTRYLINDFCYKNNIPWIYASATASLGTVVNFVPGETPCFRCLYGDDIKESDASCDLNGVILPILTTITSHQVTEALKILLGLEYSKEEMRYNIWTREESIVNTSVFLNESCPCQTHDWASVKNLNHFNYYTICSGDTIQVNTEYSLEDLESVFLNKHYEITKSSQDLFTARKDEHKVNVFKTGKLICHSMTEQDIQSIFEGNW